MHCSCLHQFLLAFALSTAAVASWMAGFHPGKTFTCPPPY